jgi:hypothetical protein
MNKYIPILVFLFLANFGFGQVNTIFRTNNIDFTITNKDIYNFVNSTSSQSFTNIVVFYRF